MTTVVLIPICVQDMNGGYYGGPSGYYRRPLGDPRDGPLIVEPGVTVTVPPLLLTDERKPK